VSISNCGSDERDCLKGGIAGDQTGKEWRIRNWYNGNWNVVLHHPDKATRNLIAEMARKAAENDLIGYDQNERLTFWKHLKVSNYDPAKITVACEADCSSGVGAIVKGAGYRLGDIKMQNVSPDIYTGNERTALKSAGFKERTASKYLTSDTYLFAGDILLREGHHTAINLTNGIHAFSSTSIKGKLNIDGVWGQDTTRTLQSALNTKMDGIISGQGSSMTAINKGGLLSSSWKLGNGGSLTIGALQRKVGVTVDGYFGVKTCKSLQKYLGTYIDGYVDNPSMMVKELQRRLNAGTF
jgi:hypothetical protein